MRFRRPTLFLSSTHWRYRYLYILPVGLLGVATFGAWGVDTSSNPIFCGSCHEMRAYFSNWKASPHAKSEIGCPTCHYEPGLRGYAKAKMQGLSELVISLTGTASSKPNAHVNDENCLRSGCHILGQLAATRYVRRVYYFNHATHMHPDAAGWRGPQLRCTSCHADVGPESHFAVDTNACFTCHFHGAGEPQPAMAAVGCATCHAVPQGERGLAKFDHAAAGVTPRDTECAGCHAGLSTGSQVVEERRCRHCHLERSAGLLRAGATAIHTRHVRGQGIACDWCHDEIRHRQEPQSVAAAPRPNGGN
jgi:nitrate/TMAO reductase-like tetraheme cytochrome c subunit